MMQKRVDYRWPKKADHCIMSYANMRHIYKTKSVVTCAARRLAV